MWVNYTEEKFLVQDELHLCVIFVCVVSYPINKKALFGKRMQFDFHGSSFFFLLGTK